MTDAAPELLADDGTPLAYGVALDELEAILAELDASTVDVDQLAQQVKRASALVRYCRSRLAVVRNDMSDVVDDLRGESSDDG